MTSNMEMLYNEFEIKDLVQCLGARLTEHFKNEDKEHDPPVILGVLTGAVIFTADLFRECKFLCELDFIGASSYKDNKASDEFRFTKEPTNDLAGRQIILVEDIIDSGRTIEKVKSLLIEKYKVDSILTVALFARESKKEAYANENFFIGEYLHDQAFVIGYGFDDLDLHRNLKNIYQKFI